MAPNESQALLRVSQTITKEEASAHSGRVRPDPAEGKEGADMENTVREAYDKASERMLSEILPEFWETELKTPAERAARVRPASAGPRTGNAPTAGKLGGSKGSRKRPRTATL